MKKSFFFLSAIFLSAVLEAASFNTRWTGKDDKNSDLLHVLYRIADKTGIEVSLTNLMLIEDRALATSHFIMLQQMSGHLPMKGHSIRIWKDRSTGETIQVEARVGTPPARAAGPRIPLPSSRATVESVQKYVKKNSDDPFVTDMSWVDEWNGEVPERRVKAKGRRGYHRMIISLDSRTITQYQYEEFPQIDRDEVSEESDSIPVKVYPIYEEVEDEGTLLKRIDSALKHLSPKASKPSTNPYEVLTKIRYLESKFDPILGLTVEGRKQGYWAMSYIKGQAARIQSSLPQMANDFSSGGRVLEGRYTTINLHPDVLKAFKHLDFTPTLSPQFRPDWRPQPENPSEWEMVPTSTLRGKPLLSMMDAYNRPATRDPKHDPERYINEGFDEVQVYWAVTKLMESLAQMGFRDPELSTRRFHAFLYDPDISYRDNAYYTDDTINFTTYSAKGSNMARDNTTIWHELGHGVMDRLMGDYLTLADTGGLSEGMADFVAQLVLNDVTSAPFPGKDKMRIINQTGFYLTNEVHDDGEAYGGSMHDLLVAATKKHGKRGLVKVTDLTLETMRLTRNHPGLTANDWFNHMLFADELGNSPVRSANELQTFILDALSNRNFNLDGSAVATYGFKHGDQEVVAGAPGSRQNPIPLKLKTTEISTHPIRVALKSSNSFKFKYPIQLKVALRSGPLQGAIQWTNEDKEPFVYTIQSDSELAQFDLIAKGICDEVNRPDGSCVDYAYVQVWNKGDTKPVAKKRFYLRVYPQL